MRNPECCTHSAVSEWVIHDAVIKLHYLKEISREWYPQCKIFKWVLQCVMFRVNCNQVWQLRVCILCSQRIVLMLHCFCSCFIVSATAWFVWCSHTVICTHDDSCCRAAALWEACRHPSSGQQGRGLSRVRKECQPLSSTALIASVLRLKAIATTQHADPGQVSRIKSTLQCPSGAPLQHSYFGPWYLTCTLLACGQTCQQQIYGLDKLL